MTTDEIIRSQKAAAFRNGYHAARQGFHRDACPHVRRELAEAWLEGWDGFTLAADENGSHTAW